MTIVMRAVGDRGLIRESLRSGRAGGMGSLVDGVRGLGGGQDTRSVEQRDPPPQAARLADEWLLSGGPKTGYPLCRKTRPAAANGAAGG